jgi:hypothetical protein
LDDGWRRGKKGSTRRHPRNRFGGRKLAVEEETRESAD